MRYDLKRPCKSCPFVIAHSFPLRPDRIEEIRDCRGTFSCHNTVDYDAHDDPYDDEGVGHPYRSTKGEQHCMGFLIVCWADWHGFDTLNALEASAGSFDPYELPTPEAAGVFGTWDEMIEANRETP